MPKLYSITNEWTEQQWFSTGGTRAKKYLLAPYGKFYYFKRSQYKEATATRLVKDFKYEFFLTEIASLSIQNLPPEALSQSDVLRFEIENDNEHDPDAVKVYKSEHFIGYIKRIHCRVFHKPGAENLKLSVKAIDKNGSIKRIFVNVSLP